jgi:hypothetical protein
MSTLKVYQQFVRRVTISIPFTLMDTVVIAVCLSRPFGELGIRRPK